MGKPAVLLMLTTGKMGMVLFHQLPQAERSHMEGQLSASQHPNCLDILGHAQYFSNMDLSLGYWQVKLIDEAKDKTLFVGIGRGLWKFTEMPSSLSKKLVEWFFQHLQ